MARTVVRAWLEPSATDERTPPIHGTFGGYRTDLGLIDATSLDENSLILLPEEYIHDFDRDESLDADWRGLFGAGRCWQTTVIYEEQISEPHPHLVPYLRRDPWTRKDAKVLGRYNPTASSSTMFISAMWTRNGLEPSAETTQRDADTLGFVLY